MINNCGYPEILKCGMIYPVYKMKGDQKLTSCYRPISILNIINKIFKGYIYEEITSFLNKFNMWELRNMGTEKKGMTEALNTF
jgi:hypothetical protein